MTKIPTYDQPVKETSRTEIWSRAVALLTKDRGTTRLLSEDYARQLWDYCVEEVLIKYGLLDTPLDKSVLEQWCQFSDSVYAHKNPRDLRVAYFAGPEPHRDLEVLISLGINVANVWAFESEKSTYNSALRALATTYPDLKLYFGKFEEYLELGARPFDIIYLDFTAPLFSADSKPYRTLHAVFERHALSELGVLITNTCEPDNKDDSAELLTSYFFPQEWVEGDVYGEKNNEGEQITWFTEGPLAFGHDLKSLRQVIDQRFGAAYSAFCTHYPLLYSSLVQPAFTVLRTTSARRQFFTTDKAILDAAKDAASTLGWLQGDTAEKRDIQKKLGWDAFIGGDLLMSPGDYPMQIFVSSLEEALGEVGKQMYLHFAQKESGGVSRFDSVQLFDLFRSSVEGYWAVLSKPLLEAIPKIQRSLPDRRGTLFCDSPLPNLWVQLALHQLGHPYHSKLDSQWRATYIAKTRHMLVDLFVFDQCRSLYEWLPTFELYGEFFMDFPRQLVARMCVDAIGKQCRWALPQVYSGAAMIGFYTKKWAREVHLPPRINLNDLG